ncbi:hypothetical protein HK096_007824 [Nowakowskiella sp. JEL0078]|nr:hypothetical protein HK096_007824 [Nowakowskiella sp. JEL0078]
MANPELEKSVEELKLDNILYQNGFVFLVCVCIVTSWSQTRGSFSLKLQCKKLKNFDEEKTTLEHFNKKSLTEKESKEAMNFNVVANQKLRLDNDPKLDKMEVDFRSFRRNDWLQGSYIYALYRSYGLNIDQIAVLFVIGFLSSAVFGTVVGSLADNLYEF